MDYFDDRSRFEVIIESQDSSEESKYFISVKKRKEYPKIFEGLPTTVFLQKNQEIVVEFQSIFDEGDLNILVENLGYSFSDEQTPDIIFSVVRADSG